MKPPSLTAIGAALSQIVAAWPTLALSAVFAVAFAAHLAFAPDRFPPVGALSLSQLGLPSEPAQIDPSLRQAGAEASEAAQAALPYVEQEISAALAAHPWLVRTGNTLGLILAVIASAAAILARARRHSQPSRLARPGGEAKEGASNRPAPHA